MNNKKIRARIIFKKLEKLFPKTNKTMLKHGNNWELLVAVILSAQCTDKKVNEATNILFKKYKKFDDYLKIKKSIFEKDIRATGFYRSKTKNILSAARFIKEKYNGKIPKTIEEMIKIPGVGRKTANVVLGNAYGITEGIAVDTHVFRLAHVLNLSKGKTPELVEKDLMKLFPQKNWFLLSNYLIEYGRKYCSARKHDHKKCPLSKIK